jgi:rod shape-determining protein MreC
MERLQTRPATLILLAAIALFGLLLYQTHQLQPLEDAALDLLATIQRYVNQAGLRFSEATGSFGELERLRAENERLQAQVSQLAEINQHLAEVEHENALLRQQLQFKQQNPGLTMSVALVALQEKNPPSVIGQEPGNFINSVIISQGADEGIVRGMPVVTASGLVGRVTTTGAHAARVLLITDPSSSVDAVVQTSRATGIVQGVPGGKLVMRYVRQGELLSIGDLVMTSGLSGNFPKGLVIGQIVAIHQRDVDMLQEAEIRPAVDFGRLESVLVIKSFAPLDYSDLLPP